jgi:hypothetical protein
MKRCPTCQQTYPDPGPDHCPNDGTRLISDAPQQQYYAGGQPPPYGTPNDPSQWQQPPGGYYPQQPGQPPGQYPPPPYGGPYAPTGGRGISKAALITGIAAAGTFALGFVLVLMGVNNLDFSMIQIASVIILLSLVAGLAAIVLGIVTLVMAGKNPAISKVHGILALVLGAIPIIFWLIGMANYGRYRY